MANLLTTTELISELWDQAEVIGPGTECNLLKLAAERLACRLEELDERVDIMQTEHEAELKTALDALAYFESTYPCDEMSGDEDEWCEKNCKTENPGAVAGCWKRYLYEWKAKKGGKE